MEYYKSPERKGRFRSFLDKEEQSSPREMDGDHHEEKTLWRNIIKSKYTPNQTKINPTEGLEVHQETSKPHHSFSSKLVSSTSENFQKKKKVLHHSSSKLVSIMQERK